MNDELENTERLYQQLSGSETTKKENLDHLKVCFQGDSKHGLKIIQELMDLDGRVENASTYNGNTVSAFYWINTSKFIIEMSDRVPPGYRLLDIEAYLDEEESCEDTCQFCDEIIDEGNPERYYNDGERCCESCYDEDLDNEDSDDEECEQTCTHQVSDLESSELMYRQLSETNSNPKEVINSKLSELSSLSRRRRR